MCSCFFPFLFFLRRTVCSPSTHARAISSARTNNTAREKTRVCGRGWYSRRGPNDLITILLLLRYRIIALPARRRVDIDSTVIKWTCTGCVWWRCGGNILLHRGPCAREHDLCGRRRRRIKAPPVVWFYRTSNIRTIHNNIYTHTRIVKWRFVTEGKGSIRTAGGQVGTLWAWQRCGNMIIGAWYAPSMAVSVACRILSVLRARLNFSAIWFYDRVQIYTCILQWSIEFTALFTNQS